jgi:hypothetical protein
MVLSVLLVGCGDGEVDSTATTTQEPTTTTTALPTTQAPRITTTTAPVGSVANPIPQPFGPIEGFSNITATNPVLVNPETLPFSLRRGVEVGQIAARTTITATFTDTQATNGSTLSLSLAIRLVGTKNKGYRSSGSDRQLTLDQIAQFTPLPSEDVVVGTTVTGNLYFPVDMNDSRLRVALDLDDEEYLLLVEELPAT